MLGAAQMTLSFLSEGLTVVMGHTQQEVLVPTQLG